MNSRLDWLVLSDYYSIYVTNASASSAHPSKVAQPNKRLDKDSHAFFCWLLHPTGYVARLQLREDEIM